MDGPTKQVCSIRPLLDPGLLRESQSFAIGKSALSIAQEFTKLNMSLKTYMINVIFSGIFKILHKNLYHNTTRENIFNNIEETALCFESHLVNVHPRAGLPKLVGCDLTA